MGGGLSQPGSGKKGSSDSASVSFVSRLVIQIFLRSDLGHYMQSKPPQAVFQCQSVSYSDLNMGVGRCEPETVHL